MSIDFGKVLLKLFPPGEVYTDEDEKLCKLLSIVGKEFEYVHNALNKAVNEFVPGPGMFFEKWKRLTQSEDLQTHFKSGWLKREFLVSNNRGYFGYIVPQCKEEYTEVNKVTISGIKNERTPFILGQRINQPLAKFDRDEDAINRIERVKHAHVTAKYEEQINA